MIDLAFKCTDFATFVADMLAFEDAYGFEAWQTAEDGSRTLPRQGAVSGAGARVDFAWIDAYWNPKPEYDSDDNLVSEGTNHGPHMLVRVSGDTAAFIGALRDYSAGLARESDTTVGDWTYEWLVLPSGDTRLRVKTHINGRELFAGLTGRGFGSPQPDVSQVADRRLSALADRLDAEMAGPSTRYPRTERETWSRQAEEARARKAWDGSGDAPPTPMLDRLAGAEGVTADVMSDAVLTKADEFAKLAGDAVGRFRALRNAIDAIRSEYDTGVLTAAEAVAEIEVLTWG